VEGRIVLGQNIAFLPDKHPSNTSREFPLHRLLTRSVPISGHFDGFDRKPLKMNGL
jgi:hypothetical protein